MNKKYFIMQNFFRSAKKKIMSWKDCMTDDEIKIVLELRIFGDKSGTFMAEFLENNNPIKCLNISYNFITNETARALAKFLAFHNSIHTIELADSEINDYGICIILNALQNNCVLQVLSLKRNRFGKDGLLAIAKMIKDNKSIKELYLDGNFVYSEGCYAVANSLNQNKSIKILSLSCCSIEKLESMSITNALLFNSSLQYIYLCGSLPGNDIETINSILFCLKYNTSLLHIGLEYNGIALTDIDKINGVLFLNREWNKKWQFANKSAISNRYHWVRFNILPNHSKQVSDDCKTKSIDISEHLFLYWVLKRSNIFPKEIILEILGKRNIWIISTETRNYICYPGK